MTRDIVHTDKAPKAIGPYSQAIRTDSMIYTAGQTGLDPVTGELVEGGVEAQTRQVLTNLQHVLEAAGSSLGHVVKTTVFLKDMNDFSKINEIYASYLQDPYPARETVEVARLPKDARIEISVVAKRD